MKIKALGFAALLALSTGYAYAVAPVISVTIKPNHNISFTNTPAAGAFSDTFSFTLPNTLDKVAGSVTTSVNIGKDVDFTSIVLTYGSNVLNFQQTGFDAAGVAERWVLTSTPLWANQLYSVTLNGTSTGKALYTGQITFAAVPVPEPETYGMLLAGLGLVGLMARRKAARA